VKRRGLHFFSQPLIGQTGAIPPIGMAMMFLQTNVHFNDVAKSVITPVLETWWHLNLASWTLAILALGGGGLQNAKTKENERDIQNSA